MHARPRACSGSRDGWRPSQPRIAEGRLRKHQGRLASELRGDQCRVAWVETRPWSCGASASRSGPLSTLSTVSKRKDADEALELASMLRGAIRGKRSQIPIGGGCGNRKHRISCRSRQLQVITGNPIPTYRNQKTAKSTFGKTLCQLAKSNPRSRREGRTWETCPPPRPWAAWHARFCRVLGMRSRESWRAPSCGYWQVGKSNHDGRRWLAIDLQNSKASASWGPCITTFQPNPSFSYFGPSAR